MDNTELEKFKPANAIKGWGVDADFSKRPGVPMETQPQSDPGAHWQAPPRQVPQIEKLKRMEVSILTPVFGTCQPIHGLSGELKRRAYSIPEHKASHWLLLLLSDRVDVLESGVKNLVFSPVFFIGLAGSIAAFFAFKGKVRPYVKRAKSTLERVAA